MANIRRLAGDTVWYGLSSIVGRVINILLLPVITSVLPVAVFGGYSTLYSMVGILFVFYTLRLETAYFRFGSREGQENKAYSSALMVIYSTSIVLSILLFLLPDQIVSILNLADGYRIYIPMLAVILFFDAINEIPFCQLRLSNRPRRFALIKIAMILTNVAIVCFFFLFCPWLMDQGALWISTIYSPENHLSYLIGA
ncbi:MAG TPA: oligosaccharide flippase family protein, partial [Sphingobacteriaceae bacterium]|nr:oligosaccharide flippase family protein [Sphingobacteriaceae bacterium]